MNKLESDRLALYVAMFFYAAMDGWRDAWIYNGWWFYHPVKWTAYFSLPVYVLWAQGYFKLKNWKVLLWLGAGGLFFWQAMYWIFA